MLPDNRAHPRYAARLAGRLLSLDGRCNFSCTVMDASEGGARASTPEYRLVPNRVFLSVAKTEEIFECEVRWRRDGEIGLRFIDSAMREDRKALLRLCALAPVHLVER